MSSDAGLPPSAAPQTDPVTPQDLPKLTAFTCSHCGKAFSDGGEIWVGWYKAVSEWRPTGVYHDGCVPRAASRERAAAAPPTDEQIDRAESYLLDFIQYEPGSTMRPQRDKAAGCVTFLANAVRAAAPQQEERTP